MTTFFVVGIVLNVVLTGLALYWLWRQRLPKKARDESRTSWNDNEQKKSGQLVEPDEGNEFLMEHARLLISSYRHWTGRDLIDPGMSPQQQSRALYEVSFVVASHGTGDDPIFNYGNRAALVLFETGWNDFTSTPSRLSAEPMDREERAQLLDRVDREGFIDDYSGVRITSTGRRFRIRRATVWNVIDANGAPRGQAVIFRDWEYP